MLQCVVWLKLAYIAEALNASETLVNFYHNLEDKSPDFLLLAHYNLHKYKTFKYNLILLQLVDPGFLTYNTKFPCLLLLPLSITIFNSK